MKIGIDARMYGPEQGGIGRYIQYLIHNLEKIDDKNEYVVFLRKQNFEQYIPSAKNFKKKLADIKWYGLEEQIFLPRILKKEKLDLMHFPHWNIPIFYKENFVMTIHDLLLFEHPSRKASLLGPIVYAIKYSAFKKTLSLAIKHSLKIITPSECVKQDIIKKLDVPAEKIAVTHLAPSYKNNNDAKIDIAEKYNLKKPYILYVGVAYPHKNLENLLNAWKIFQNKHGENYNLVLAGKKNYFYNKIEEKCKTENIQNVIFTDFVNDNELPGLYKKSALFVFPSLSEGFGIPPLEAMQYDVPVASSDHACMKEILGPAAIYFNPASPEDMAEKIHIGITNQQTREKCLELAKKQLEKYSWKTTAKNTLAIYQTYALKSG